MVNRASTNPADVVIMRPRTCKTALRPDRLGGGTPLWLNCLASRIEKDPGRLIKHGLWTKPQSLVHRSSRHCSTFENVFNQPDEWKDSTVPSLLKTKELIRISCRRHSRQVIRKGPSEDLFSSAVRGCFNLEPRSFHQYHFLTD
jgi:hypothetical protein